jgi:hypothetical protein
MLIRWRSCVVSLNPGQLRLGHLQERSDCFGLDAQAVGDQARPRPDLGQSQSDRMSPGQLYERPIPFHAGTLRGPTRLGISVQY